MHQAKAFAVHKSFERCKVNSEQELAANYFIHRGTPRCMHQVC